MKDSSSFLEKKSMFSVNTMMSAQTDANNNKNKLWAYYNLLMPEHSYEYPYLSKIYFLQLIFGQQLLLFSQRRIVVKDVWVSLSKNLMNTTPNIYIIDSNTNFQDIFKNKPENHNRRYMLLDLDQISNKGINFMLNNMPAEASIMSVQPLTCKLQPQISSLFSLCFKDQQEQNFSGIIQTMHVKLNKIEFKFSDFYENVQLCVEHTEKNQQQEGFLKTYINLIKQKLNAKGLNIVHSKWKKALKLLNFIGTTKFEGVFKKFSLPDCCLAPHFLASSLQELQILSEINERTILELLPYYGTHKFRKNIKDHFWIREQTKNYYFSMAQKMNNFVSFFYPCSKYPETASIHSQNNQVCYRIQGYDKKLMSDKFIEVDTKLTYKLSLKLKTSCKMINHIGLACYDAQKQPIQPVQVCRKNNSEVIVSHIEDNKIYVKQEANLANWTQFNTENQNLSFAYERCIGVYSTGETDQILPIQSIIMDEKQAYSKQKQHGAYAYIGQNYIQVTPMGKKWFFIKPNFVKPGKTVLMNHYQGGTYVIGQSLNHKYDDWTTIQMKFNGQSRQNLGKAFFSTTKYIRVVIMINYNSGHPNYNIAQKDAFIEFKEPKWFPSP